MAPPGMSPFPRRAVPPDGRALRDGLLGAGIALGTLVIGAAQSPARVRRPARDDSIPAVRCVDGSVPRAAKFMLIFNDGTRRSRH